MKIPLSYQITNYDCGTMAFINAISYLYDREEIIVDIIKGIYIYTLDRYDKEGNYGQGGTSKEAVILLIHFFNELGSNMKFNINSKLLEGKRVNIKKIREAIDCGGVVIVKCYQSNLHYVLVTDIDEKYVYIFDSYYLDSNYVFRDGMTEIISDKPFKYNRKVKIERFMSKGNKDFSLGIVKEREAIIIMRL